MHKKGILRIVIIIVLIVAAVFIYGKIKKNKNRPEWRTDGLSEGSIREVVTATGSLNPFVLVEVGTEVSGKIERVYKDFNDRVRQGELLAKLDTEILQTSLQSATGELERARNNAEEARLDLNLQQELFNRGMTPEYELMKARFKHDQAVLSVNTAELSKQRAEKNLANAFIKSPIDGIIVSRDIEAGQTVAASMNAPTLFKIANNLNQMQITAEIDEADIGKIRVGLPVEFSVDAYPQESFEGSVQQIRLNPNAEQNVVSYSVIINADNPQQKLLPGMTTNVTIVVQAKENVLRIPETATRFRPSKEIWEQMGLEWSDDLLTSARRQRPGGAGPGAPSGGAPAVGRASTAAADSASRGGRPSMGERPQGQRRPSGGRRAPGADSTAVRSGGQFNPRGTATRRMGFALVWVLENGKPVPKPVRTGISDGAFVEVIEGVEQGVTLITGVNFKNAKQAANASSPTMGPGMGRRF